MNSFYEIGGILMDGTFGYDHRKFKRVRRELKKGNVAMATAVVLDHVVPQMEDDSIPYSELQLKARKWAESKKRTLRRIVAPLPISPMAKTIVASTPNVVDMWSRGVGSYDMRTPDVQRYEESVTWGGSGGMVI